MLNHFNPDGRPLEQDEIDWLMAHPELNSLMDRLIQRYRQMGPDAE